MTNAHFKRSNCLRGQSCSYQGTRDGHHQQMPAWFFWHGFVDTRAVIGGTNQCYPLHFFLLGHLTGLGGRNSFPTANGEWVLLTAKSNWGENLWLLPKSRAWAISGHLSILVTSPFCTPDCLSRWGLQRLWLLWRNASARNLNKLQPCNTENV